MYNIYKHRREKEEEELNSEETELSTLFNSPESDVCLVRETAEKKVEVIEKTSRPEKLASRWEILKTREML